MRYRLLLFTCLWFVFSTSINAQETTDYRYVYQDVLIEYLNKEMGKNDLGIQKIKDFRDTLGAQMLRKFQMDCAIVERNVEGGKCSTEQKKSYESYLQNFKDSIHHFKNTTQIILDNYQKEQDANILFFLKSKITFYEKQNNCKVIFQKGNASDNSNSPDITREILATVQSHHLSFIELISNRNDEMMIANIEVLLPEISSIFNEKDYASIKNRWKDN